MKLNKYWFKPKKYGYGAYPSSWEGYLVIILFILGIFVITKYTNIENNNYNPFLFLFLLIIEFIFLIYISKNKTQEKWKFRWGEK